ncbi:unnamed protein product, partial [Brassica rapa]
SIFASLSSPLSSALPELCNKAAHDGSVSGVKARSRRLLQLHRRRFLSPRGGGFVSSAIVGLDHGGFSLLVWFGLVETTSEDDRSSTMVNGDGSREVFLSMLAMNAPVDPGESTVGSRCCFEARATSEPQRLSARRRSLVC